jgi:hypothetical protein
MRKKVNRTNKGLIGSYNLIQIEGANNLHQQYTDRVSDYNTLTYYNDEGNTYAPPSAWRSLPTINVGDQKFAGVFAVYNTDGNFLALRVRGAYTVDWGDGTTGAFADNATAYKRYTQSTYAGLTSDVYNGYKTLVIQIAPQTGNTFTELDLDVKHNEPSLSNYTNNWLNILMSAPNLTSLDVGSDNITDIRSNLLEQFIFLGTNNVTTNDGRGTFAGATNLRKVFIDTTNFTTMYRVFYQCHNLRSIPFLNLSKCTSLLDTFFACYALKTIPWMDTSNVTNFQGTFQSCTSLLKIPPLNTSKGTNFSSLFLACYALTEVPNLDFSKATTISRMFDGCYNLKFAPRIYAPLATTVVNLFSNCINLVYIPEITISSATTSHSTMFNSCFNLEEVPFFNTSNSTNFQSMFQGCRKLRKVPNYNTQNVTNFINTFFQCSALMEIPRWNYSSGRDFSSFVNQCYSLRGGSGFGFTLSNGITFSSMFSNCQTLEELSPLDMRNCRTLISFGGCVSLKEVTLNGMCGATSGLSTTAFNNMFLDCQSLRKINAPMDLSGYTGSAFVNVYSNMFLNCFSLEEINGITGFQHNLSVANCHMGATALNSLYSSLAVVGASGAGTKTITVTNNWGTVNDNPSIATSKGWTVTG